MAIEVMDTEALDLLFRGWVQLGTGKQFRAGSESVRIRFGMELIVHRDRTGGIRVWNRNDSAQTYAAQELGGVVFCYRPNPEDEMQEVPAPFPERLRSTLEACDSRICSFAVVTLPATLSESAENVADVAHFTTVHSSAIRDMPSMSAKVEDGSFVLEASNTIQMMRSPSVFRMTCVDAFNSIAVNDNRFANDWFQVTMAAPLGNHQVEVLIMTSNGRKGVLKQRLLNGVLRRAAVKAAGEDIPIWSGKQSLARPVLSDADGPIMQFRKWHAQFRLPIGTTSAPQAVRA